MTQVCKQEVFGHEVPILGTVEEPLLKAQNGVIRIDDRFVSSLKKLIDIYENERSKLSEINAEELFQDK